MESIGNVLANNPRFRSMSAQVAADLEANPIVQQLKMQYPEHHFANSDLMHYAREQRNCSNCQGLETCKNDMSGLHMIVKADSPQSPFAYTQCPKQVAHDRQQQIQKHITSHNIPDNVLNMTFAKLENDEGRKHAIVAAMTFCVGFERGKTTEGLYFTGGWGVGKSALTAGAMANELAKRGVDVIAVYVPDFLIEIKAAIRTNTVSEKIEAMKNVSVLILDDIGAEPLTAWTRDEVLGPILQARMEKFPTIYTSNLSLNELEQHLATTKDAGTDWKKAARLMERIDPFVQAYEVRGENRRRNRQRGA